MIASRRLQHVSSGGLALLVHGVLLLGLVVGVSWKNPPHLPIEADIWTELPAPPQPIAPTPLAPPPELKPEPAPEPTPAPKPEPDVQAQIALEKVEKKRLEDQRRQAEVQAELLRKQEKKLEEDKRVEAERQAEQARVEKTRLEKERVAKEQAEKREQKRRFEQDLERQTQEALAAETSQLNALRNQNRVRSSDQNRVVADFQERIRAKIRDGLVLPQNLKGDAAVEFLVNLMPDGEVLRVTLVRTSGQPLYDNAVERAIFRASPLPLPRDRETARPFREGLTLKFRPSDDATGYP